MRIDGIKVSDAALTEVLEDSAKSAYRLEDMLALLRAQEEARAKDAPPIPSISEGGRDGSTTPAVLRIVETDGEDGDRR
jgi:hypothetical protein